MEIYFIGNSLFLILISFIDQLGFGGVGYIWPKCEGGHEEEWRHSVAPITEDKILEAVKAMENELELILDGNTLPPSGELIPNSIDSDEDDNDDSRDEFDKEVRILTCKLKLLAFCGCHIFNCPSFAG
jgi:translation initiation factor eIF-2B subunit epsilon